MSNVTYKEKDGKIIISLSGRIDSSNAAETEKELAGIISASNGAEPVFNMGSLSYISSAGLRILMRVRKADGRMLRITEVSPEIYDILDTTGFTEIFEVSKKMREISIDGCEIIGRGFYGTVYRIDDETIVKAYKSADSLAQIKNEKRLAKTALIAGVPTAISYDIVRIGDSYGSVFELLKAKTFNDMLIEQPENADSIIRQYAEFLRLVNSREVPAGKLSSAKKIYLGYLEKVSELLTPDKFARLKELFDEIPEQHFVIHGDAQMKNVMLGDGEPMLIDMDTLCEGHPIFDLQSLYITYFAFGEDDPANSKDFLGISDELVAKIWNDALKYYLASDDEAYISSVKDRISVVGCVRFLYLVSIIGHDEFTDIRLRHTNEHLDELLSRVDTLVF